MNSRKWTAKLAWCLTLLAILGTSIDAHAQRRPGRPQGRRGAGAGGGGGGGGMGGPLSLIGNSQVQTELKLTDDQKSRVEELTKEMNAQRPRPAGVGIRGLSQEEREKRMEENRAKTEALNAEAQKKIDEILTADQRKRFRQISLQQRGNRALADEQVVKELGLDEQQVALIKEALADQETKMRELMREGRGQGDDDGEDSGGGNFAERREKMQAIRQETEIRVQDALTEGQAKAFEAMKGERFKLRMGPGRRNEDADAD